MNRYFSLNNIKSMFIRHFVENGVSDLYYVIFTVVFFGMLSSTTNISNELLATYMIISVVIFSSRFFTKVFNTSENAIYFLLIPASRFEKMVVQIILGLYYIVLIFFIALLGIYIGDLFVSISEPMLTLRRFVLLPEPIMTLKKYVYLLTSFMLWQALFMFGSIYFKKNPVIKTLVTMLIFSLFLGVIIGVIFIKSIDIDSLKYIFNYYENVHNNMNMAVTNFSIKFSESFYPLVGIINILGCLFFWILSYLKLKEREV